MQTGAFVQFIVLFVAISSRMSALSLELVEALQLGILACNRLLVTIHVSTFSALEWPPSYNPTANGCPTTPSGTGGVAPLAL